MYPWTVVDVVSNRNCVYQMAYRGGGKAAGTGARVGAAAGTAAATGKGGGVESSISSSIGWTALTATKPRWFDLKWLLATRPDRIGRLGSNLAAGLDR